jgi:hypothetical protein
MVTRAGAEIFGDCELGVSQWSRPLALEKRCMCPLCWWTLSTWGRDGRVQRSVGLHGKLVDS